ncbi:MAG: hypothetical protein KC609_11990, partial [Myxococcales bacterium]|nr:hypothetical protein [Myxococcales bacterium]
MSVVRITLLLATIVAVLERPAHAGAIELDRATASILIHPRVDVVRDEGGRLTLEEVRGRFDRSTVGAYSFGFTNAAYWYRFTIANRSTSTLTRLLVFRTPWLDRVVLYEPRANGRYRTRTFGDRLPFHQRELDHRCFVLRLEIPRGETTYYARLQVSQAFMTPISLWQPEAFRVDDSRRSHYFGAIYGVILVMLLYNLFIFLSIRDTRYLYYCFYLFAFGLMNVSYNGYSFAYLWPNAPTFSNWTYSSWIFLFQLTGLLFAIKFLETRKRSPRLHAVVLGVCGVMCATWGGSMLFGLELIYNASAVFFVSLYSPLVALAGIVVWRTGYRAARFFVVASLATLVGSFVTAATAAGFIRYSFATFHATEFGLMIDITLLSFALADRLRLAQAEHELAQKQTRSALETLVHERTAELESEPDRAEELARTDPQTKLANRRALEEQIARKFERARRYSRDLS